MPVTIDQVDVDVASDPTTPNNAPSSSRPTKPDPREVQKQIELQSARLARIHAD
jgi:hypothetical protein